MPKISDAKLAEVMVAIRDLSDIPFADLDIEVEDIDFSTTPERAVIPGLSTPPKPKPHGSTVKISLRVPTSTRLAVKDRAARIGGRYQSLVNTELKRAVAGGWAE